MRPPPLAPPRPPPARRPRNGCWLPAYPAEYGRTKLWFEAYLREHGIDGADDHHPDVGSSFRPDYRVHWGDDSAICEVKEFKTTKADERFAAAPRQPHALSPDEVYGAIRRQISYAAKQLKAVRGRREALVIVLANPGGMFVPLGEPEEVMAAMYGNPGYRLGIRPDRGAAGEASSSSTATGR